MPNQPAEAIEACPSCDDFNNECGAIYEHGVDGIRLQCDCGCCGAWGLDLDEALSLWNRVASLPRLLKAVEEGHMGITYMPGESPNWLCDGFAGDTLLDSIEFAVFALKEPNDADQG